MKINEELLEYNKKIIQNIQSGQNDYICFGAGKACMDFIHNVCQAEKFQAPEFICDNNEKIWGKQIKIGDKEVPVVSPEKIRELDIDRTYIFMSATLPLGILNDLIYKYRCVYHKIVYAKSLETYFFFLKNRKRVELTYNQLEDQKSKTAYEEFLNTLLRGNFFCPGIYTGHPYWGNDVINGLQKGDTIVHAGVFDGADIQRALIEHEEVTVHGFEPDINMYQKAKERFSNAPNIKLYPYALSDKTEELSFNMDGSSGAVVKDEANPGQKINVTRIKATSIDEVLINEKIDLITLDIEGLEPKAIMGAEKIICTQKPRLAICVYHELEHYVLIAEMLKKLNPEYKLYFRQHSPVAIESVLYAI